MAQQAEANLITNPSQPDAPPYRPFPDRPSGTFVQEVAEKIKETGQPELVVGLYRGKIDRSANFRILRKIQIDRKKRPNGDMAPCPRCGREDHFLEGVLAWFHQLQFCAVIGHCCATHVALDAAEREFKWREKRDYEETYLLEGLPKLATKHDALTMLRSPCGEAIKLYRQFRREAPAIHQHLRQLKAQRGGHLVLTEVLRGGELDEEDNDYVGPAGFRGRGGLQVETRDIDLGFIEGQTAVARDFNPMKKLDNTDRVLMSFGLLPTAEQALDLIAEHMNEHQRRAAVAILQEVDRGFAKVTQSLADFWQFFTEPNISRLNKYGMHPENPLPFETHYRSGQGRTLVTFKHRGKECRLLFADKFAKFRVDWPG
jgi:hypothetical protein